MPDDMASGLVVKRYSTYRCLLVEVTSVETRVSACDKKTLKTLNKNAPPGGRVLIFQSVTYYYVDTLCLRFVLLLILKYWARLLDTTR